MNEFEFRLPVSEDVLFVIALRAARGDHHLADEVVQHVRDRTWRGLYDPARGEFLAWATTVIRRYCIDALCRPLRGRGRVGLSELQLPDPRVELPALELRLDLTAPFCPEDERKVRSWAPRSRFVLLGWHGLWDKLPALDQKQTLEAVRPAEPFPVADFFAWPDADRTRYLARALRCRRNTVVQIRRRGREQLASLRFIRELRGD